MIKPNELMLGNWVLHDGKHAIVKGITDKMLSLSYKDKSIVMPSSDPFENLQPIILTNGWLRDLGFSVSDEGYCTNGGFALQEDNMGFYMTRFYCPVPVGYVHRLQNLYYSLRAERLPC